MTCPTCKSTDTVTTRTETRTTTVLVGLCWISRQKREQHVESHRCLDCGCEWAGQEEKATSPQAVGTISQGIGA